MVECIDYKERLVLAMKEAQVSTRKLADKLGVSYQAVKKVLDGKTNAFTAANNDVAASFLGVNSRWLATGKGPIRPPADGAYPSTPMSFGAHIANDLGPDNAYVVQDEWLAEAIQTLTALSTEDRRAAVLNLRVFVSSLDRPSDGQGLPVAA